ncbi:MAG TPA: hypothetical protein VGO03_11795 [Acidimicrobiia bacterium]
MGVVDESERTTADATALLGAGFGVALLVCAAAELAAFASPLLVFHGGFFVNDWPEAQGPFHLLFAAVLGVLGLAVLVRRGLPAVVLCVVVPSLAVAAADGGFGFYLAMRARYSSPSGFAPTPHATVGTWGALVVALLGAVLVVRALPTLRTMSTIRLDARAALGATACAAALVVALLLNRFADSISGRADHQFGAAFFGFGSGVHGLDLVAAVVRGVIVLLAVGGGVLFAGALGRTRPAALLLVSSAFGALLFDNYWLFDLRRDVSLLPAFWLLVAGAAATVLLAGWCWLGEPRVQPPAAAPDVATLAG